MRALITSMALGLVASAAILTASLIIGPAQAADRSRDCADCPPMIVVPAGVFRMGASDSDIDRAVSLGANRENIQDEKPQHQVSVKPFLMSATEVTLDQFEAFVRATGYRVAGPCLVYDPAQVRLVASNVNSWRNPGFPQTGDHPVACVNWNDAKAYVAWLSKKTGKHYRLPSEAEWEYAARNDNGPGRHLVEKISDFCRDENVRDASAANALNLDPSNGFPCTDNYVHTAPVAQFRANGFGLNDMLGNVREWTEDCYHPSYVGAPMSGAAWQGEGCARRVFRGGSWDIGPWGVRAEGRFSGSVTDRYNYVGFRVARSN